MTAFDWRDPFRLEDQLGEEERGLRDGVARYAADRLAPLVVDWHAREHFDPALYSELGRLGLLGSTHHGYGCPGLSHVSYGLAARELERVDTAFRSAVGAHSGLAMGAVHAFGSETQKQRWLPAMAAGSSIGAFGLTEPDHGSDPSGMAARARRSGDGWLLSGTKVWITNAHIADVIVVWVKDDDGRVQGFVLERGMAGLGATRIEGKMGARASPTGIVAMSDVRVSEEHRLPGVRGLSSPLACLSRARFAIAWGSMGAAEACWLIAREHSLDRRQFGAPLAARQLVQKKLADMQTEIALGLQAALRVSRLADEGAATPEMLSLVKRNNAGKALEIARVPRDMLGADGISGDRHVIRHVMNLEVVNTLEGTHDIHALVLGRAQTGISAF